MDWKTIGLITTPVFTAVLGYITNWTGVWMIFKPVKFAGFRVPGLATLVRLAPRKVQQVPGFMHGAVGWQGIIPSRAGKLGSIAVDKQIEILGNPREFFDQLEPDEIAAHIIEESRHDMRHEGHGRIERPTLDHALDGGARQLLGSARSESRLTVSAAARRRGRAHPPRRHTALRSRPSARHRRRR